MNDRDNDIPSPGGNGRRVVVTIVAVALLASVTTLILALTASHRAREADAAAMASDSADLHGVLSGWRMQWEAVKTSSPANREGALATLDARASSLAVWKPRTPCGETTRDALDELLRGADASIRAGRPLDARQAAPEAQLDRMLVECEASKGRDVTL